MKCGRKIQFHDPYHVVARELMRKFRAKKKAEKEKTTNLEPGS